VNAALTAPEGAAVLQLALPRWAGHRDELRDLDAAVGDGDLGITVQKGADAVCAALQAQQPQTWSELLRTAAKAFSQANPSTMAALVGGGLLAASKVVDEDATLDQQTALQLGRAVHDRIAERGKAEPGDKTVLDALRPSLDALEQATDQPVLPAMIDAARAGVEQTTGEAGRRGRAAWVGDRGRGHPDPGATAYLLFLQALAGQA